MGLQPIESDTLSIDFGMINTDWQQLLKFSGSSLSLNASIE